MPEATRVYQQIVAKDDRQIRAYLAMVQVHARAGKFEEAEKSLALAEKVAGNSPACEISQGCSRAQPWQVERRRTKPSRRFSRLRRTICHRCLPRPTSAMDSATSS
jgi:hypothetical protein